MSEAVIDRPAVLEGLAEWTSRPAGLSAASPVKLASLVDGALDRADRV
ncbi:MAG: hypothetical protein H7323_04945, partial [Frankiales bacterium]|nr:hypothetical protein [Frankiales bacterium]